LTVEVLNTDAEGRLVLADCMSWTQKKYNPTYLFDFATLTSACMVALGLSSAGIIGNDEHIIQDIVKISNQTHEPFWHLPLDDWHRENVASSVADL